MKKYLLILMILSLILSKCHVDNRKLQLINKSKNDYFYRLLTDTNDLKKGLYIEKIPAHDSVRPLFARGGDGAWEYQINTYSPDSTLNLYLFDQSTLTDELVKHRKFRRLTYKIGDLNRLNWKLIID